MRAIVLVLCLVISTSARAGTVVVMAEPNDGLGPALEVALANRRVAVAELPSPPGSLRLDRAAAAQRAALGVGADAAVWVEIERDVLDVCAVSSDGRVFRHAPVGRGQLSPRVFAAVATSLLDELLAPPEAPLHVDVDVNVTVSPGAAPVAVVGAGSPTPAPMVALAPGLVPELAPGVERAAPAPRRTTRMAFEIGPMLNPVAGGIEGVLLFPMTSEWSLGVIGIAGGVFVDNHPLLFASGIDLRAIVSPHLDVGVTAGGATADGDAVGFAGLRFNIVWSNKALSFTPLAVFTGDTGGDSIVPGFYTSLRWSLPL